MHGLAERHADWLRPAWEDQPEIWHQLLTVAMRETEPQSSLSLRALQRRLADLEIPQQGQNNENLIDSPLGKAPSTLHLVSGAVGFSLLGNPGGLYEHHAAPTSHRGRFEYSGESDTRFETVAKLFDGGPRRAPDQAQRPTRSP